MSEATGVRLWGKGTLGFVAGVVAAALSVYAVYRSSEKPDFRDASSIFVPIIFFGIWFGRFLVAAALLGALGIVLALRYG